MLEVLAATGNVGKIREFKELFADFPIKLRSLNEFENIAEPEETGISFAENAILKARYYAGKTGIWALADDSGLEVEALNGAPGIFSARYGGENLSFQGKIEKLLGEIEKTGDKQRIARFVCAMAISDEKGEIKHLSEGICRGTIAKSPIGINGFGYDPIFIPQEFDKTFGELPVDIKHKISHRAQAIEGILEFLNKFHPG